DGRGGLHAGFHLLLKESTGPSLTGCSAAGKDSTRSQGTEDGRTGGWGRAEPCKVPGPPPGAPKRDERLRLGMAPSSNTRRGEPSPLRRHVLRPRSGGG